MDTVLQAISDESRRILLGQLREGPATVNELAALLPIARPGVSRHLRVLREVGLVDVRNEAQRRIYSLRRELDEWLDPYRAQWEQRLDALHTEIARGKAARAVTAEPQPTLKTKTKTKTTAKTKPKSKPKKHSKKEKS